jgi:hypothetical protein
MVTAFKRAMVMAVRAMMTATKRARARATRGMGMAAKVAGNEEGDGKRDK